MNILDEIIWGEETEALRRLPTSHFNARCPGLGLLSGVWGLFFFFFFKDINSSRVVCEGSQRRLTL